MSAALPLLQLYWKQENPREVTWALVILGALAVFAVIWQIAKNGVGGQLGGGSGRAPAGFSKGGFRKAARAAGMAEDELRFLEEYGRALGVSNPEFLFRNRPRLDAFFKDVYRHIEKNSESEAAAEERKASLFAIRERLSVRVAQGTPVTSTRQLGRNTPLSFITPDEENYPSIILAVEPGGMAVEPVRDAYGEPIKFRKGTKLTCYFYTKGHQGYQFQARVSGWQRIGAKEALVLSHSDAVAPLPSRRFERRDMRAPCQFYRVAVTTKKVRGKEQASARVEGISYPGTIIDISAGGAGIQSANALAPGEFIKIELDAGDGVQSAFGKVVRMNRAKGMGGVMHLQFVKIGRRALNSILSFVYGYSE